MLHEVEQNVDVVVRTLSWIFLEELTHTVPHDQRLTQHQSIPKIIESAIDERHVLQPLLPDKTNYSYNLRSRYHNRQLIINSFFLYYANWQQRKGKLHMLITLILLLECCTPTHTNCYLLISTFICYFMLCRGCDMTTVLSEYTIRYDDTPNAASEFCYTSCIQLVA